MLRQIKVWWVRAVIFDYDRLIFTARGARHLVLNSLFSRRLSVFA